MRDRALEAAIVRRAAGRHRIVTRRELLELGLGSEAITYRVRTGRLHAEFPGVYAVGTPATTAWERAFAAVVAGGPGAVLAELAALALWRFVDRWPAQLAILTPHNRRPRGLIVHRTKPARQDRARRQGIPVTSPARTVLDCAPLLPGRSLTRVVNDALHTPFLTRGQIAAIRELHPRHPGARLLRAFHDTTDGASRADWEDEFPEWCMSHGLPRPLMNHPLATGTTVDAYFPAERVIVELDGWGSHSGRDRFESDRDRDAENLAQDRPTVRVTKRRMRDATAREAERLERILALRRRAG